MRVNKVINILAETFKLKDMERYRIEWLINDVYQLIDGCIGEIVFQGTRSDCQNKYFELTGREITINEIESN